MSKTSPDWITPFLGGVATTATPVATAAQTPAATAQALLRDASGHGVLVDLSQRRRLWRSSEPLWPLALDDELAFGLSFGLSLGLSVDFAVGAKPGPKFEQVQVLALEAASGVERWRSAPLPWPAWACSADAALAGYAQSDLRAGWVAATAAAAAAAQAQRPDLLLAWRLRQPAAGVQRWPPDVEAELGACRLARPDGVITQLADPADCLAHAEASNAVPQSVESGDPDVVAQQLWQGVRYALALRPGGAAAGQGRRLLLEAAAEAETWQCLLDDTPVPPFKPRPVPPSQSHL